MIERAQRRHLQVIARLGKGAVRDPALRARAGVKRGEKAVQRGLLRQVGHRQQRANQRGQWQFATAGEGIGVIRMPSDIGEFVVSNSR